MDSEVELLPAETGTIVIYKQEILCKNPTMTSVWGSKVSMGWSIPIWSEGPYLRRPRRSWFRRLATLLVFCQAFPGPKDVVQDSCKL